MADTGYKGPGTAAASSVAPYDDNDFNQTAFTAAAVQAKGGTAAECDHATFDTNDYTYLGRCSNYNMGVLAGATINGIEVTVTRLCDAGAAKDGTIRIVDEAGNAVGDDKKVTDAWPGSLGDKVYGGASDTWGWTTVTAAKVNNTNFGVMIAAQATSDNTDVTIDYVGVKVYYTGGSTTSVRMMGMKFHGPI